MGLTLLYKGKMMLWLGLYFKATAIIIVLLGLGASIGDVLTQENSILMKKKSLLMS